MASTYTPIATYTVPSAQSSYTFTTIPSTYTDLVLVFSGATGATDNLLLEFNGDNSSNYSTTFINGNGSTSSSSRFSSRAYCILNYFYTGSIVNSISHIQNYSNTSTYKTLLTRDNDAAQNVMASVSLWRNTSSISSIKAFWYGSGSFSAGSTLTLYGIKAA